MVRGVAQLWLQVISAFIGIESNRVIARTWCGLALISSVALSGCILDRDCIPTGCGGPVRLFSVDQELAPIAAYTDYADVLGRYTAASSLDAKKAIRNEFIFERIYAMDVYYTVYEESLTKESQSEGFWAAVTNAALTGTAALIPVAQTARILSGIAAGLTTADQAYNKQFLYSRAVQILQSQMRARRADIVSHIVIRASKSVIEYPLGMAMTDLEEYYRAGTLAAAFIDLSEKIGTDASTNKRVKDVLKGGGDTVTAAQVRTTVGGSVPKLNSPPLVRTRSTFVSDDAGAALTKYLYPNGVSASRDPAHAKVISDFLKERNINAPISFFLDSAMYSADRTVLARRLTLIP